MVQTLGKRAILEHCWDESKGWFFDLEHASATQTDAMTIAGVFPLYFGIASPEQAARIAANLETRFRSEERRVGKEC